MRRFKALLIASLLAAAPASAVAGPSHDPGSGSQTIEWSTSKGRLGVMVMSLTPELRKHFGAAEDRGVLVAHIEPGSPAATAGIAVGDVIVEVRGQKIEAALDVRSALASVDGPTVAVDIVRDGKPRSLQVSLDSKRSVLFEPPHWLREWMDAFEAKPLEEQAWPDKLRELFQLGTPNQVAMRT